MATGWFTTIFIQPFERLIATLIGKHCRRSHFCPPARYIYELDVPEPAGEKSMDKHKALFCASQQWPIMLILLFVITVYS